MSRDPFLNLPHGRKAHMTPTDATPPPDPERRPIRVTLSASLLMSAIAAFVPAAVTWGVYKQRIETIEKTADQQAAIIARLDSSVSELRVANAEMKPTINAVFQRLDSIDRQLRRGE